jgi:hypothetical protein
LFFLYGRNQPIANTYNSNNTKERQYKFAVFTWYFSTPSSSVILNKADFKPTKYRYRFIKNEVCFNVYFAPLVDEEH